MKQLCPRENCILTLPEVDSKYPYYREIFNINLMLNQFYFTKPQKQEEGSF